MKSILVILCFYIVLSVDAQSLGRQVVGSTGTTLTNGAVTVNFTVGETIVGSISDGTTVLSQGFHQGKLKLAIKVNPIVFLQGASVNSSIDTDGLMRDDIRGSLPIASPYSDNVITDASVFAVNGAGAIVDWIWVELRSAQDSGEVVASQSALLQRNGDIVAIDGVSDLEFDLPTGDYYIMVNHRNHLGMISANTVSLSSTVTTLDFSTSLANIQGGNNTVTEVSSGVYALIGGDYADNNFTGNGQIQNSDINAVIALLGEAGYNSADMDMNGQIQNSDINNIMNPNVGKGEQFTTNSSN